MRFSRCRLAASRHRSQGPRRCARGDERRRAQLDQGGHIDKTRFDRRSGNIRLGQAVLRVDGELLYDLTASVVASAADDRRKLVDINEAWLGWNPVPDSA